MAKDVVVTFETIFDLARKEKDTKELQKIDFSFFNDARVYLADKQRMLDNANTKQTVFAEQEKITLTTQVANIKKMLRELYDRRQKKIVEMAISKARTNAVISTSAMLPAEKALFDQFVAVLVKDRETTLSDYLTGKSPLKSKEGVTLRCKEDIEEFVDKKLNEYGPYQADQKITLPHEVAKLLIQSGKAEKI